VKKHSHVLPCAALLTLALLAGGGCSEPQKSDSRTIDLSGTWKISGTDNPDNALPSMDDSRLAETAIPGDWISFLSKNDDMAATVWIRKKIFIPAGGAFKQPMLFIERVAIADEAYLNGVKIAASGLMPSSPGDLRYQIAWYTPRRYFIPQGLIRYGADNVIALRVYSHIQSGIMGEVSLRDYGDDYFGLIMRAYRPLIVSITAVMMNIMLILVFALLYISEKSKRENLYFTLVIACTVSCSLLTFPLPFLIDGLWRYKLGIALYTLTNFFVLHGVKSFIGFRSRALDLTALGLLALVEIIVLSAGYSRSIVYYSAYPCLIFVNLCILGSAGIFIHAVIRDPRRYWYFLALAVPLPVSVMRNSYYLFAQRFNELPLVIFLHVPAVFMFITLYYIYNFEKSKKEKDQLYTALLKKSKKDTRALRLMQEKKKKPGPRDLITNVIEYLDNNYAEKYDRIELSKKFGLNEDYMGQIFRKATGTNISTYINTNRINAAKELLTGTNAKIIDVAYHVGFDNLTHFHRQFKKQTGCTPNEYREIVKKNND